MWGRLSKWIRKFECPLIIFVGSICLTALLLNVDFNYLEASLYDLRISHGFQSKPNQDIILITLDDLTTKELDEFAPLPLSFHTQFLETLEQEEPKAIGYLVDMNHVQQMNPIMFQNEWAKRFISSVQRMRGRGIHFLMGTPFDVTGEVLPPTPLNSLPHSVAVVHRDGNIFSEDKVTRRALLSLYEHPAFHLDLARRLGVIGDKEITPGAYYVPEVDGEYFFFRYHGSTVLNRNAESDLPYPRFSFSDIIHKRITSEFIKGKIVLVSTLSSDDSGDFAITPYSKDSFTNPKILVHANILDSIIQKDGIVRAPNILNWLVTFIVTAIVLWWIMTSTPLYGLFATLALAFSFFLIGQIFFQFRGLWIKESQPLVGIFLGYYLMVPYRLIREYKKRWEYQKKNLLLTQVEELKTNFLSLVTHDLKTPVARIQGLAEVLLRQASNRLEGKDKDNIHHIIKSTEELNRFISSILELSKVETNHIQLKLESKDINQLIERTIEDFSAQAKARQIKIYPDLEPLFPVKVDAVLITKVLNNLIDNALKYSPSHSEICVKSREDKDWIIISVEDRGIGMTESECENLFTRFYRAKNEMTNSIPGTGLGLYLTKYFVEAHKGRVEVKSEKNRGSVFSIFIPIQETNPAFAVLGGD